MNSAEVIRADGHARVQVGDSYSVIHNYPYSNRYLADSHLTETDKAKVRNEFLQRLFTSPYEKRKNRNPERADGTCEWFTAHRLFQNWREETSALLWVSADPGCGKSVLARYLVDDLFPSSATRTTCYFFFKDDFDDQRTLEGALCCILHQLFTQKPVLLSDEILENFREEGEQLFTSFPKLWDILMGATRNQNHGEIICIIDALDECMDQTHLANALTQHYSKGKGMSTLKLLVTSRPYLRIQRHFQNLKQSHPTIHLSGESQEETDKIAQEIAITINQRIEELCTRLQLSVQEKNILQAELATGNHRTYLWVHLVFPVVEEAVFLNNRDLIASIRNLPRTVEEAYDNILRKSQHPVKARKILHIVVATDRPLHLTEMAAVLAFQGDSHRYHKDLERDLLSPERLLIMIREACGLFVVIQDSRVFLLHQTAKEFLIQSSLGSSDVRSFSLEWRHSLDLKESHRLLSEICIRYLLLADFKRPVGARISRELEDRPGTSGLAALRHKFPSLLTLAESLDSPVPPSSSAEAPGDLKRQAIIISYHPNGHQSIVQYLLERGAKVDARDVNGITALMGASVRDHEIVIQRLLDDGAKVDAIDKNGITALMYASVRGHDDVIQRLLDGGAKVDAIDNNGITALIRASVQGHDVVIQRLLDGGAKVDAIDNNGITALMYASVQGHDVVIQRLLDGGAEVDAIDENGITALIRASAQGHDVVIQRLLDGGAKIDAIDNNGMTALMYASVQGHDVVIQRLLDGGAKIDAADATTLLYSGFWTAVPT
ncbi:hypothetical protein TruAng_011453 [Truncatella angustata]|nr:hypothetical protein TruAng_011453 [Truncatella angustata]